MTKDRRLPAAVRQLVRDGPADPRRDEVFIFDVRPMVPRSRARAQPQAFAAARKEGRSRGRVESMADRGYQWSGERPLPESSTRRWLASRRLAGPRLAPTEWTTTDRGRVSAMRDRRRVADAEREAPPVGANPAEQGPAAGPRSDDGGRGSAPNGGRDASRRRSSASRRMPGARPAGASDVGISAELLAAAPSSISACDLPPTQPAERASSDGARPGASRVRIDRACSDCRRSIVLVFFGGPSRGPGAIGERSSARRAEPTDCCKASERPSGSSTILPSVFSWSSGIVRSPT